MAWIWLNIFLAAAFFAAWTGIPLWLMVRHPDTGPAAGAVTGRPRSCLRPASGPPSPRLAPALRDRPLGIS